MRKIIELETRKITGDAKMPSNSHNFLFKFTLNEYTTKIIKPQFNALSQFLSKEVKLTL